MRVHGHKDVVAIPNAVQTLDNGMIQVFRALWREGLGLRDNDILVVGIGRLVPQKNFARFIDVIAQVRQHTPVQAVIVGEDFGCLPELQQRVAALGLQDALRFLGRVPNANELMCAADIFLLSSDHEGMPNVVLEAMAAGVPCVCTRVNGVADMLRDGRTGFVVSQKIDPLAHAVRLLANDGALRKTMGNYARNTVCTDYQPEAIARQLWEVCE